MTKRRDELADRWENKMGSKAYFTSDAFNAGYDACLKELWRVWPSDDSWFASNISSGCGCQRHYKTMCQADPECIWCEWKKEFDEYQMWLRTEIAKRLGEQK